MSEASDVVPSLFSPGEPSQWQSGAFRCNQQDKSQAEAESGANAKRSESSVGNNLATAHMELYYLSVPWKHILNCRSNEFQRVNPRAAEIFKRTAHNIHISSASGASLL